MTREEKGRQDSLNQASKFFVIALLLFLALFFAKNTHALTPQLNYQAKLTNASGVSVSDGSYDIKLVIYDAATGGTCQYSLKGTCGTPTAASTTVTSGLFSLNLGDTSSGFNALSSTLFNSTTTLFLGVTVNTDSEMTPRKKLTSAPFAFNALNLGGVSSTIYAGTTTLPSNIQNYLESPTATSKVLVIRGNSSQSAHLFDLQNSSASSLAFINASGGVFTSSTLQTTGNLTAYSAASISGLTTLSSGLIANASSSVASSLQVAGNLSASGTLTVNRLASHLLPNTNNTYDLGSFGNAFKDLYASGTLRIGSTSILDTNSLTLNQTAGTFDQGRFFIDSSGNLAASGTAQTFGLATLRSGFISNASSSVGAGLQVSGALSASGTLQAAGATSLNSTLAASGLATLQGGFISNASSSVGAGLQVAGALNASSTFQASNLSTLTGGFISGASSSITSGGLRVGGNLSASSSLTLASGFFQTSFTDCSTESQTVLWNETTGQFSCGTDSTGAGATTAGGWTTNNIGFVTLATSTDQVGIGATTPAAKLHIRNIVAASSTLVLEGAAAQTADVFQVRNSSGNVTVSFNNGGAVNASGTLRLFGLATFSAGLISSASSSFADGVQVAGALNASGTLQAAGATVLGGTLSVSNLATLSSGLIANASSSIASGLQVAGNLSASSTATFNRIASNLTPNANNTYDLGSFGNAWKDIYASGTLRIGSTSILDTSSLTINQTAGTFDQGRFFVDSSGNLAASGTLRQQGLATLTSGFISSASSSVAAALQVAGALNASGTLQAAGATVLGGTLSVSNLATLTSGFISSASSSVLSLQVSGNLSASSTATFNKIASNLTPNSNNTYDLGAFGNAWKDIYASGTLRIGSTSILDTNSLTLNQTAGTFDQGRFLIDSSGNLSASGTLRTFGLATFSSGFISNASSSVGAGLQIAGALNASGTLQAAGATVLGGTLTASGLSTFSSGFISSASSSVLSLQVAQALNASSSLLVGGAATLNSTLAVTGLSTLTGGFISNASSSIGAGLQVAGNLSASSSLTIAGNILPDANNTRAIGAFGLAFGNVFASGTSRFATVEVGTGSFGSTSTINLRATSTHIGGQLSTGFASSTVSGSSITIDWNNGNNQAFLLDANTTFTFTGGRIGGKYLLKLRQDATGSRTVTWPSTVIWSGGTAPTLTTTANKNDFIGFAFMSTTSFYGVANALNFAD